MARAAGGHKWRFFRAGGFDQVRLDRGEDLLALAELDQKLWVALACPTEGLEFDKKTLDLIDVNKDGRIRAPELLAAVKWAGAMLKDAGDLVVGKEALALSAIDTSTDEGKRLHASAKLILKDLGKKDAKEISLDDTADTTRIFAETKLNGDGILPPGSAESDADRRVIEDILACLGGQMDRSGEIGVTQDKVDHFFTEAAAFVAWWSIAERDAARVLPLGEATAAGAELIRSVQPKVDDYFTRCRLAAFDARAAGPLNRDEAEYAALASSLLSAHAEAIAALPLARIAPSHALPLTTGLNPAWAERIGRLRAEVLTPLLGDKPALADAEWESVKKKMETFDAWHAAKVGAEVEKLGAARVRELLGGGARASLTARIAEDLALGPEADAVAAVDKLIRFHQHLYELLNNFVSFTEFYAHKKAIFQAGTLYLDSRSCDLCVRVADSETHAAFAAQSKTFLAYCACARPATGEKMTIAAAFTDGDSDDLTIGRNGLFYDREGRDWDATIVKLVQNPVSVRAAFWLPYKRVLKLIGQQIEKLSASRDKDLEEKTAASVESTGKVVEASHVATPPPAAKAPATAFDIAKFAGIFAAIGLTLAAIGTAIAEIINGLLSLRFWQVPLVIGGVMLLISGPSMIYAWVKLRQRNVGPILDGNGWAVNARAKMNIPFGASLTGAAKLPKNAERSFVDPYAEKTRPWVLLVLLALGVAFAAAIKLGYIDDLVAALRASASTLAPAPSSSSSSSPAPSLFNYLPK